MSFCTDPGSFRSVPACFDIPSNLSSKINQSRIDLFQGYDFCCNDFVLTENQKHTGSDLNDLGSVQKKLNNVSVSDKNCIVMKLAIKFDLHFKSFKYNP